MTTIQERVKKGAELLDQEFGAEWPDRIDTGILDIKSTCNCVLGQLGEEEGKDYSEMLADLGFSYHQNHEGVFDHGFDVPFGSDASLREREADYAGLTEEWLDLLNERTIREQ